MTDHPADGIADELAKSFKGLLDGTNIKQSVRDAWDRVMNKAPQPTQPQPLSEDQAQSVRAKAQKIIGIGK